MVRVITGAARATSAERSSARERRHGADGERAVRAAAMRGYCGASLRRLTSRVGRNTPAFIISISAVPPAIGRTVGSSGSSSVMASGSEVGSSEFERGHVAVSDADFELANAARMRSAKRCSMSLALERSTGWPMLPSLPVSVASTS